MILSDWKTVNGVKIAFARSYKLNGIEVQQINYKDITANTPMTPATFAIPDAVKTAAKPAATANVPYQWVVRRLFLGRFTDSDKVYFSDDGSFKVVELSPNVQMVQGGGANNLIVNMKDGLAIIDAPTDEGQSRFVIDAAKAKYPGKPIKYLVLTHHHMDHTGGMRAFVAEGATVYVPSQDKAYFEQVAKAPHTLEPDAQQKAMKPATHPGRGRYGLDQGRQRATSTSTTSRTPTWTACSSFICPRTTSCGSPTSFRRADRSGATPARSPWARRCASTTSPAP